MSQCNVIINITDNRVDDQASLTCWGKNFFIHCCILGHIWGLPSLFLSVYLRLFFPMGKAAKTYGIFSFSAYAHQPVPTQDLTTSHADCLYFLLGPFKGPVLPFFFLCSVPAFLQPQKWLLIVSSDVAPSLHSHTWL
jgi:hypothetical protein